MITMVPSRYPIEFATVLAVFSFLSFAILPSIFEPQSVELTWLVSWAVPSACLVLSAVLVAVGRARREEVGSSAILLRFAFLSSPALFWVAALGHSLIVRQFDRNIPTQSSDGGRSLWNLVPAPGLSS